MKKDELYNDIISVCETNAKPEIVEKYSRYFKGGFNGYGLETNIIIDKVKEYKAQEWCTIELVKEVSELLIPNEKFEVPSFATSLLNEFAKEFDFRTFQTIEHWFSIGINNWAHTDGIAQLFFPIFWKKEIIQLSDLESWKSSNNKFQRRCVPVAMIKFLKHDSNFDKHLNFIDSMMMDNEREVHQGLGWFLRECWKKEPKKTENFLLKWKNSAARLIFQYATEKMTKEYRVKFRRDKQ